MRRTVGTLIALIALAAACTSEDGPDITTTQVVEAEVVQTVAAAAELQPAARVTVNAPVGGEVAELLVGDGDVVETGDPVVRLASDSIDQQVAQAEAAVESAEELSATAAGAGLDLSPLLGAFRAQLDAVFPPVIDALRDQVEVLETATEAVATLTPPSLPDPGDLAPDLPELDEPTDSTAPGDAPAVPDGPDSDDPEVGSPEGGTPPAVETPEEDAPASPEIVDQDAIDEALADTRARVAEVEAGYLEARGALDAAAADTREQSSAASAAQEAAARAQLEQATLALRAVEARVEELTVVAPGAGVVELARADAGGAGGGAIAGLPDAGAGALGDVTGLLGGGAGAASSGPLSEGVDVSPGQPLLSIFDLSGFTARVLVDELDVVEVEVGQPVIVLVDAFPQTQLGGEVSYIALEPERQAAGGSVYPVTVTLETVPTEVELRVGLTASAEIETLRVESETVVPTSALLRRDADEVVHVIRDGIARAVPVRIVAIGEETAAVDGDLAPGEPVVSSGLEFIEDGEPIAVDGS